MRETSVKSMPISAQIRTMKWNFWIANIIEAFERMAFYGVRAVLPLYMFGTLAPLGLTMGQKGLIYAVWAVVQCLVPMVSGGYTESYGYKLTMFVAFTLNIIGYSLMGLATGFLSMLLAAVCVGMGTAIFKPPVQGAVAQSLNEGNSSLGFGIFYWMVNVGGFVGPMIAIAARGTLEDPTWNVVFFGAAAVTAINFIPAIFLFREPPRDPAAPKKRPFQVFGETMGILWRDQSMLRFLLIISGFWFMFMQIWDTMPNFIEQWVDTRSLGDVLVRVDDTWVGSVFSFFRADLSESYLEADGAAKPDLLIQIDAFTILLLVIPLSWLFGKMRMMKCLVLGMAISLFAFLGTGLFMEGKIVALMIFFFAIGEIACSPKFSEYIGVTAPADKKAIYMGYSNIPYAIGWGLGNLVSGFLYDVIFQGGSRPEVSGRQYRHG